MSFGENGDEQAAADMFHVSREAGINCFDCANIYQDGRSEQILGRWWPAAGMK
jgi:aryl-alcohol dehydrogenase-like predicted oxidoreductase